jgi:hypothetical protein
MTSVFASVEMPVLVYIYTTSISSVAISIYVVIYIYRRVPIGVVPPADCILNERVLSLLYCSSFRIQRIIYIVIIAQHACDMSRHTDDINCLILVVTRVWRLNCLVLNVCNMYCIMSSTQVYFAQMYHPLQQQLSKTLVSLQGLPCSNVETMSVAGHICGVCIRCMATPSTLCTRTPCSKPDLLTRRGTTELLYPKVTKQV